MSYHRQHGLVGLFCLVAMGCSKEPKVATNQDGPHSDLFQLLMNTFVTGAPKGLMKPTVKYPNAQAIAPPIVASRHSIRQLDTPDGILLSNVDSTPDAAGSTRRQVGADMPSTAEDRPSVAAVPLAAEQSPAAPGASERASEETDAKAPTQTEAAVTELPDSASASPNQDAELSDVAPVSSNKDATAAASEQRDQSKQKRSATVSPEESAKLRAAAAAEQRALFDAMAKYYGAGPGFTGVTAGKNGATGIGAGSGFTGFGAGPGYTGEGAGQGSTGFGAGPGYTGVGAGPGSTGIGAGSGFTGFGAGPGYTGTGAGSGFTGFGAGPGSTGIGAGSGFTGHAMPPSGSLQSVPQSEGPVPPTTSGAGGIMVLMSPWGPIFLPVTATQPNTSSPQTMQPGTTAPQ